jgi:hyperosmotically inducible protein
MKRPLLAFWAIVVLCGTAVGQPPAAPKPPSPTAQPGTASRIGEQIDRGLSQIGAELSQAWAEVRKTVEKMGVQGRVYGRLHWDKALEGANLDVSVRDGQIVVLSGTVHSAAARQTAEQLTRDTVGVTSVVNELAVTPAK